MNKTKTAVGSGVLLDGEKTTTKNKNMCEQCQNWPRGINENPMYAGLKSADGIPLLPNHHPNCPNYNDSLMDVWKITDGHSSCYVANEQDARDISSEEYEDEITVTKQKMHREILENLREFEGF